VRLANERLEKLAQAEKVKVKVKVKVWLLIVDGTRRYTATTPKEAMNWMARFSAAHEAAPDEDMLDCDRRPVYIEVGFVYADELPGMPSVNEKPEDFGKW